MLQSGSVIKPKIACMKSDQVHGQIGSGGELLSLRMCGLLSYFDHAGTPCLAPTHTLGEPTCKQSIPQNIKQNRLTFLESFG
jgi:hypothetical protein